MARRGSRPSLYEVGQPRLSRGGQETGPDGSAGEAAPGRTSLRIPLGFMWLIVLGGAALVIIAWVAGRGAGVEEARTAGALEAAQARVTDPLHVEPSPPPRAEVAVTPPPQTERAVSEAPAGDPLVSGLYYFVLAEWRPSDMERLADFCRSQGLEVAVVSGDNARLAKLIALPGLRSDRSSDPAVQELASRIAAVGRLWRAGGGKTSFDDKYLMRKGD
ncbi:MAG: hypothetical protein QF733_06680 [Phycisphaerales bacterium]|nr:hypothetical protein [Phycisphaerales bacterium]